MNNVIHLKLALPLPAFPVGDVSGKVWSTLITTKRGICPQSSLGFAIFHVSSLTPIYWHFLLCVYSLCTNILPFHVLSVK